MTRALLTTLAIAGTLAVAIPAFAQQGGPGPGAASGSPKAYGFSRMCENHDARLAGMLAFAEKKLKITDAQKAAWTKFADQAQASGAPMQAACAALKDKPQPANAIERLERMDTIMTARQTQMHQMLPAIKEMYGQLSPEQQKVADGLLSHGPRHGMGGHHGNGPGMMGGQRG